MKKQLLTLMGILLLTTACSSQEVVNEKNTKEETPVVERQENSNEVEKEESNASKETHSKEVTSVKTEVDIIKDLKQVVTRIPIIPLYEEQGGGLENVTLINSDPLSESGNYQVSIRHDMINALIQSDPEATLYQTRRENDKKGERIHLKDFLYVTGSIGEEEVNRNLYFHYQDLFYEFSTMNKSVYEGEILEEMNRFNLESMIEVNEDGFDVEQFKFPKVKPDNSKLATVTYMNDYDEGFQNLAIFNYEDQNGFLTLHIGEDNYYQRMGDIFNEETITLGNGLTAEYYNSINGVDTYDVKVLKVKIDEYFYTLSYSQKGTDETLTQEEFIKIATSIQ